MKKRITKIAGLMLTLGCLSSSLCSCVGSFVKIPEAPEILPSKEETALSDSSTRSEAAYSENEMPASENNTQQSNITSTGKITVYAPDGRQALIPWDEHDAYIRNGWYCKPIAFGDSPDLYLAAPATDMDFVTFANTYAEDLNIKIFEFAIGWAFDVYYSEYYDEWYPVTDSKITSLADVEKEFYRYFAKSSNKDIIYEGYCEMDGGVYARAIATDFGGSEFNYSSVNRSSDTEVQIFGKESRYSLGDEEPYEIVNTVFTMVLEDGKWKYRCD